MMSCGAPTIYKSMLKNFLAAETRAPLTVKNEKNVLQSDTGSEALRCHLPPQKVKYDTILRVLWWAESRVQLVIGGSVAANRWWPLLFSKAQVVVKSVSCQGIFYILDTFLNKKKVLP